MEVRQGEAQEDQHTTAQEAQTVAASRTWHVPWRCTHACRRTSESRPAVWMISVSVMVKTGLSQDLRSRPPSVLQYAICNLQHCMCMASAVAGLEGGIVHGLAI